MKKSVIIAGAAAVVLAAVAVPRLLKKDVVIEEAPLPVVEAQMPQTGTIELYRELVGKVEPSDVVYLYPKAAGEVTDVYVKAGDMVKEGQILCRIDTKQVDGAKLSLEAAEQTLKDAQTNLARQKALFDAGDIASAVFEQAQTAAKNAQINYDSMKLNYDTQMEFANITAPISGKVEICDVEVHDMVAQQSLISVIAGEGSKSVTFSVPEKIASRLQAGDEITIEKSGSSYQGTVNEVSTMIDAATGLFKVKASVEDGDGLPTGSSAKLYVTSDKQENVMTIPVDAVYYSGGDAYVYTFDEGTVHYVPVEVGIYDSKQIQILSGITMEDQVITTWSSELYEGSKVQMAGSDAASAETEETGEAASGQAE